MIKKFYFIFKNGCLSNFSFFLKTWKNDLESVDNYPLERILRHLPEDFFLLEYHWSRLNFQSPKTPLFENENLQEVLGKIFSKWWGVENCSRRSKKIFLAHLLSSLEGSRRLNCINYLIIKYSLFPLKGIENLIIINIYK